MMRLSEVLHQIFVLCIVLVLQLRVLSATYVAGVMIISHVHKQMIIIVERLLAECTA